MSDAMTFDYDRKSRRWTGQMVADGQAHEATAPEGMREEAAKAFLAEALEEIAAAAARRYR